MTENIFNEDWSTDCQHEGTDCEFEFDDDTICTESCPCNVCRDRA